MDEFGDHFPSEWLTVFDGSRLEEKCSVSAAFATIGDDDWPHLAFLGPGEILVRDHLHVAILLWSSSRTTGNVERSRRAILVAPADGSACEARLALTPSGRVEDGLQQFEGKLLRMRRHAASYATVTGMIGYALHEPAPVIGRWTSQVRRLKRSSAT